MTTNKSFRAITYFLLGMAWLVLAASGCKLKEAKIAEAEAWQRKMDSLGNAMLDSIYKKQRLRCDSLEHALLPHLIDSLLKTDTATH